MSHVPGQDAGGVAGAQGAAPTGAVGAEEILPFTGSVLTLPIALLGVVLTFLGWLLTRLGGE